MAKTGFQKKSVEKCLLMIFGRCFYTVGARNIKKFKLTHIPNNYNHNNKKC